MMITITIMITTVIFMITIVPSLSSSRSLSSIVIMRKMRSSFEEIKSDLKTSDATAIPVAVAGKY